MSLLKPAVNQTAYAKFGGFGFQGSGKTHTAVTFGIGLAEHAKFKKIAFYDTEKGSDFHIKRVNAAGLEFFVLKSKSFEDLVNYIRECEQKGVGFLIVDSVTHVWRELCDAHLRAKAARVQYRNGSNKKVMVSLTMKDWAFLKGEWARFTEAFVNSKIHIIVLGRAGFEYDVTEDDEGKMEVAKSGTKMKAEGEFGYESDLLFEMERIDLGGPIAKGVRKKEKKWVHRCTILKDRTDTINARVFDNPSFKDFLPAIKFLNIGGEHLGVDPARNSDSTFIDADKTIAAIQRRREIAIEKMNEALILAGMDGRSAEATKARTEVIKSIYGTSAKTEIENMHPHVLESKLPFLRVKIGVPDPSDEEIVRTSGAVAQVEQEQVPF